MQRFKNSLPTCLNPAFAVAAGPHPRGCRGAECAATGPSPLDAAVVSSYCDHSALPGLLRNMALAKNLG